MIIPNKDFRANPKRSIQVQGVVDQKMVDRLVPQIIALQAESREPITVYIDSPGGVPEIGNALIGILKSSNEDGDSPCRVITVATVGAASTAADMLSAGDYAIAYNGSIIHYHGVRTSMPNPLTAQYASMLTEYMKVRNDTFAMDTAKRSVGRFIFRYAYLRKEFPTFRAGQAKQIDDLECFIGLLASKVSAKAMEIVLKAQVKNVRYRVLLSHMGKKAAFRKQFAPGKRVAELEAVMLQAVINYELSANKGENWSLKDSMAQVNDDFILLRESLFRHGDPHLNYLCERHGMFFITPADEAEIAKLATPEERNAKKIEILKPIFQPLWFFFVALCQALQEGENQLTPVDVFWLGLIDEVMGEPSLPSYRIATEYFPDPPPKRVRPAKKKANKK